MGPTYLSNINSIYPATTHLPTWALPSFRDLPWLFLLTLLWIIPPSFFFLLVNGFQGTHWQEDLIQHLDGFHIGCLGFLGQILSLVIKSLLWVLWPRKFPARMTWETWVALPAHPHPPAAPSPCPPVARCLAGSRLCLHPGPDQTSAAQTCPGQVVVQASDEQTLGSNGLPLRTCHHLSWSPAQSATSLWPG
uniref:Uncharacterized protein n=1 Tax=Myotis myotis TaxID=51298 RepID=A0A7J7ZYF0_MYOMY|nr:hypothetical protein mMyoMyo1_009923 [Myotis myotis]